MAQQKRKVLGRHSNGQLVVKERGRQFHTQDGLWWTGSYDPLPLADAADRDQYERSTEQ